MVKIIIDEECPRCQNRFESLIEFDLNSSSNTNSSGGNGGYRSQLTPSRVQHANFSSPFGNNNDKNLIMSSSTLVNGSRANSEGGPTANNGQSHAERSPFGKESNLTLGKLMNIINLIGETSNKLGTQSLNLIVEQCKLMGLTPKDEQTIYKLADMIQESDVSTKDILITLYKFCEIIGIKDDVADINYYKLMVDGDNNNFQQPNAHDTSRLEDTLPQRRKGRKTVNELPPRRKITQKRRRPSAESRRIRRQDDYGYDDFDEYEVEKYEEYDEDEFMDSDPGV